MNFLTKKFLVIFLIYIVFCQNQKVLPNSYLGNANCDVVTGNLTYPTFPSFSL